MQINVFMVGFLNPTDHNKQYYETNWEKTGVLGDIHAFNHSLIYLVNIHPLLTVSQALFYLLGI